MTESNSKNQNLAMTAHLLGLLALIGIPFGNLLGPLIFWLVLRKDNPMVDEHGKEALNFQITISIAAIVSFMLTVVLIGFFLLIAIAIFDLVMIIKAAIAASKGQSFKYPYTLRLVK